MSATTSMSGLTLAIDTSTKSSIVVLGRDRPAAISRRDVSHRHGSHVLEQVEEVLATAGVSLAAVDSLAVGTGPGSFTGLRVGMATAKTLAYALSLPLVGVPSSTALRRAAVDSGAPEDVAVVLAAGAHDHYLVRATDDPVLVAPGGLVDLLKGSPSLSIDLGVEVLGPEAQRLGAAALEGMSEALLALARERLAAAPDDVAELIPAYVALPRGVTRAADELGWSPDLR
ncbi:MAG: tRNA (adenosine(37)-N6)-threonylcarbamoyltransferase complex dimerization subunit type 1 TsaB [Chloroflexota bacterium]